LADGKRKALFKHIRMIGEAVKNAEDTFKGISLPIKNTFQYQCVILSQNAKEMRGVLEESEIVVRFSGCCRRLVEQFL